MGAFDNLNTEFSARVQALIAASGGLLRPGSGYRDINQQIALRRANGCPDVWTSPARACRIPTAIPGRSNHNHGLAMDLVDATTGRAVQPGSAADRWLAAYAPAFGLRRPVGSPGKKGWEPWHVELAEGGDVDLTQQTGAGAYGFDISYLDEERKPEDELAYRLRTVVQMLTGDAPEGSAEGLANEGFTQEEPGLTQEEGLLEDTMGLEETMIPGQTFAGARKGMRRSGVQRPAGMPGLQPGVGVQAYNPRGGVNQWRGLVAQALSYVGEPSDDATVSMVLRRMQQESGGNPTIVNKWDINAKRGDPSVGLMQVIGSTFRAHAGELAGRGQTDPFANLVASMRYAKKRYGSLATAYNRRGGY